MDEKLHVMAEGVRSAYADGEEDEQLLPRVLVGEHGPIGRIGDKDLVVFYDIRGEREIELTRAFTDPDFGFFDVGGRRSRFTTMIEYHSSLDAALIFPPEVEIEGTLCEAVTKAGKKLAKVVESEKAIHLAYFLNGKREQRFPGESLHVVESPRDVANFDEKPEMAAALVADRVIEDIGGGVDVIIVNFANVDVVGHIEDEGAVLLAIEAVDIELGRVLAAASEAGMPAVITADHGTAEKYLYSDGKINTGHTDSAVPLVVVDDNCKGFELREGGDLSDVAPTVLSLLGIAPPSRMTGKNLIADQGKVPVSERLVFVILDGWGHREDDFGNMIKKARTPVMDRITGEYPFTVLAASGKAVGLPPGKVGNSEAGHLHLGAGRCVPSDRNRIDQSIEDGSFQNNPALIEAMEAAKREGRPLHMLGIVSFYSSHGSVDHLYALLKMAKKRGVRQVFHHALLGRRGERPEAGARYIDDVEKFCEELGLGQVVTVMGRFWALDREDNWDRVEKAYRAMADGEGVKIVARSQ